MFNDFKSSPISFLCVSIVVLVLIAASGWGWINEYGVTVKGVLFTSMSIPLEIMLSLLPGFAIVFLFQGRFIKAFVMGVSAFIIFQFTNLGTVNFIDQLDKDAVVKIAKLNVEIEDLGEKIKSSEAAIDAAIKNAKKETKPFEERIKTIQEMYPGTFGPQQKAAQERVDEENAKRDKIVMAESLKLETMRSDLKEAKQELLDQDVVDTSVAENFFMVLQYVNILGFGIVHIIASRNEVVKKVSRKEIIETIRTNIAEKVPNGEKIVGKKLPPKASRPAIENRSKNRVPAAPRRVKDGQTVVALDFVTPRTAKKRRDLNK